MKEEVDEELINGFSGRMESLLSQKLLILITATVSVRFEGNDNGNTDGMTVQRSFDGLSFFFFGFGT